MSDMGYEPTDRDANAGHYEIRVQGQLGARWEDWFDGFTLTAEGRATVLSGYVIDQAQLHGVLRTLADLGLPLISVTPTTTTSADPTS